MKMLTCRRKMCFVKKSPHPRKVHGKILLLHLIWPNKHPTSIVVCIFISDPKTEDWPLIATPWPTISLVAMYLFIVKVGPKVMENRKAYSLRELLIVYNFALVLLSAWMVYEVSTQNTPPCWRFVITPFSCIPVQR